MIDKLLAKHPIISDQITKPALGVVLRALAQTLNAKIPGDIAEFGCYIGTTSVFIRRVLDSYGQSEAHSFYVYDSFTGLPEKSPQDISAAGVYFQAGELSVSKKQFLEQFRRAGLTPPITHKGWFNQLAGSDVPPQLAFAFLDGDFYESIIDSLRLVWPRLSPGGIITIDDYKRETLPGVEQAVNEFFTGKQHRLRYQENVAIIEKPL